MGSSPLGHGISNLPRFCLHLFYIWWWQAGTGNRSGLEHPIPTRTYYDWAASVNSRTRSYQQPRPDGQHGLVGYADVLLSRDTVLIHMGSYTSIRWLSGLWTIDGGLYTGGT